MRLYLDLKKVTKSGSIERLKQWEKNSNGRYEIELYWDFAPYSWKCSTAGAYTRKMIISILLPINAEACRCISY